ncbi:MAG: DMT family transporter [Candidatus Lariskella arthropodorum]
MTTKDKGMNSHFLVKNGAIINLYSALFAAFSILFAKFALNKVAPYEMALGSSLCVCIICSFLYKKLSIKISRAILPALLIVSIINALSELFWFVSLAGLPPITFSLLSRTKVVFAFFLSISIFKDKVKYLDIFLVLLIILGSIMFIIHDDNKLKFDTLYVLAALSSSFLYAVTYALAKLMHAQISVYSTLFFNSIASLIILSIFFACYEDSIKLTPGIKQYAMIILSSLFFLLSTALLLKGVHMIPFWQSGIFRALTPLILAAISLPFFDENFSIVNILGAFIILISLLLINLRK